jgi:hypothetical protein
MVRLPSPLFAAKNPTSKAPTAPWAAARERLRESAANYGVPAPGREPPSFSIARIPLHPRGRVPAAVSHVACAPAPAPRLPLQAKLEVGDVDDPLEREADGVADRVMRMSDPASTVSRAGASLSRAAGDALSRKCCEGRAGQEEEKLRRKPGPPATAAPGGDFTAPPVVHEVLGSRGRPLDRSIRAFMEPRFGRDFGGVQVHSDERAARASAAVGAIACTVGDHIVFGTGQYRPGSSDGRRLIAHELAHVVQQGPGGLGGIVRRQAHPGARRPCREPIHRATSTRDFEQLVAQAEARLRRAGWATERIVRGLTSIFYGSTWSREFNEAEHSPARNAMFEQFTGAPLGDDADPRAIIGCGLYESLYASQDVAGIDMGHALIGTDARMHDAGRTGTQSIDLAHYARMEHSGVAVGVASWLGVLGTVDTRASGLQMSTWVGDLGAAAAMLAAERNEDVSHRYGSTVPRGAVRGDVDRWFREGHGDFGAPSNLRGDVFAYSIGDDSTLGSSPTRPSLGTSSEYAGWGAPVPVSSNTPIATGIARAVAEPAAARCARFLRQLGGTGPAADGTGSALTNRQAVLDAMVTPIEAFGAGVYSLRAGPTGDFMHQAAVDVATRFLDQLTGCVGGGGPLATTARGGASRR